MMQKISRRGIELGLIAAAAVIGASGHDGWGWCLFIVFMMESW